MSNWIILGQSRRFVHRDPTGILDSTAVSLVGVGETICQASRSSVLGKCQLLSARQRCHVQLTKFQCALILGIRHDEALTILFLMRSMRFSLCPVLFRAGCPIGAKSCVGTHGGLVCLTLDLHHVKLKYKLQRSRQEIPWKWVDDLVTSLSLDGVLTSSDTFTHQRRVSIWVWFFIWGEELLISSIKKAS